MQPPCKPGAPSPAPGMPGTGLGLVCFQWTNGCHFADLPMSPFLSLPARNSNAAAGVHGRSVEGEITGLTKSRSAGGGALTGPPRWGRRSDDVACRPRFGQLAARFSGLRFCASAWILTCFGGCGRRRNEFVEIGNFRCFFNPLRPARFGAERCSP